MQQAGIMEGDLNNSFNPKSEATRAKVATMLHRYIKLTIDPATANGWAEYDDGRWFYYRDGKPLKTKPQLVGRKLVSGKKQNGITLIKTL